MRGKANSETDKKRVRLNMVVEGEPAKWLGEWKERGLVTSYTDAVIQALRTFNEKVTEQDLKAVRLNNMKSLNDDY